MEEKKDYKIILGCGIVVLIIWLVNKIVKKDKTI